MNDFLGVKETELGNVWTGNYWTNISNYKLERAIKGEIELDSYSLLPLKYSREVAENKGSCSVLDYGGGTGFVYFLLKNKGLDKRVNWFVVDIPELADLGKVHKDDSITFKSVVGDTKYDILYINTVLQYEKDWSNIIENLLKQNPEYVILTRLIAGDCPTNTFYQDIGGTLTECTFINKKELNDLMEKNGYVLLSEKAGDSFSDKYSRSFPLGNRIPAEINLVYKNINN